MFARLGKLPSKLSLVQHGQSSFSCFPHFWTCSRLNLTLPSILCNSGRQLLHARQRSSATTPSNSSTTQCHDSSAVYQVEFGRKLLRLHWTRDTFQGPAIWSDFDAEWLRFQCMCNKCRQPSSNQRLLDCCDIPEQISLNSADIVNENRLNLRWTEDGHEGWIALDWLRDAADYKELPTAPFLKKSELPRIDYSTLTQTDNKTCPTPAQLQFYGHILTDGFCIVTGLPTVAGAVQSFVEDVFGLSVQKTIYGEIFDVVSTAHPINVAYSNAELKPHIDLVYYESPPGLQLLHCLRFDESVQGGESTLVDGHFAAEEMIKRHPEEADVLIDTPATFEKIHFNRDFPVWMRYSRPHIAVNRSKQVTGVFWAPQFEGPLRAPTDRISKYYDAYRKFGRIINDPALKLEFRLQPGELLVFNNRRMLHGRNAFTSTKGVRHLQGCYVHIDEFKSQAQVALTKAGKSIIVPRVANQSSC